MKRNVLLVLAASLLMALPASAQVTIDSKGGVIVKDKDGTVKVDANGTSVTTDKKKTKVKTTGAAAKIKSQTKTTKSKTIMMRKDHGAVVCAKTDSVKLNAKSIKADVAIKSSGSCTVKVEESALAGQENGLHASGSSKVSIESTSIAATNVGAHVSGSADVVLDGVNLTAPTAIKVSGMGKITVKNSTISGKIVQQGKGKFVDGGGNTIAQ